MTDPPIRITECALTALIRSDGLVGDPLPADTHPHALIELQTLGLATVHTHAGIWMLTRYGARKRAQHMDETIAAMERSCSS